MENKMNRVYGILGIRAKHANWNADFNGFPKSTSDGDIYGSDKALKYPIKNMWEQSGEKVLYIKSMKLDGDNYRPRTLKERYEDIHGCELKAKSKKESGTPKVEVLTNLFNSIDVKNFGATFAEEGNNFGITGAVQISQGFNKYNETEIVEQNILSPFARLKADKNDKDKDGNPVLKETDQSSLGTKITSTEAHYMYHFVINPNTYKSYKDLGVTDGYTREDYNKFKEATLISATAFNTNSKTGCDNELAIFIEVEDNTYLPNLTDKIRVERISQDEKRKITLNLEILKDMKEKIKSIEVYYNNALLELDKKELPESAKYFNIFTKEKIGG